MKKFLLLLIVMPLLSYSQIIEFQAQSDIKAEEINHNLTTLKEQLENKNLNVNFVEFQSGAIISAEELNQEFEKVNSLLGINLSLNNILIKSEDLNNMFIQLQDQISIYNAPPILNITNFNTNIN